MLREIRIATGQNRFQKKWKNISMTWHELLNLLSKTTETRETITEYMKMSKTNQDNIKDVGGFVGGWLKEGLRRNGNVEFRSVLTLDADYAAKDMWMLYEMLHPWECAVYSTHKHTPDKPRLRFVFPLEREVSAEEYEAVGRWLAQQIGIDQFDDTTYQPARLMYWPSTSIGNEFFFRHSKGPWLNPDEVLARYPDWKDVSQWPMSSRESEIRKSLSKKAEDPLTKVGVIGAFCRTYSIEEVIDKYLGEIYEPISNNRYTYLGGSTSGGLVVYDSKFAYSNHSTDPVSGLLCNAFDLVRIHRFGELDIDAKEGTPVNRLPSFIAMSDFALEDDRVRELNNKERIKQLHADFKDINVEEEFETDDSWINELETDRKGKFLNSSKNIQLILDNDKRLKDLVIYNEFYNRPEITREPPWSKIKTVKEWSDSDDSGLRTYLEQRYGIEHSAKIKDAVNLLFQKNSYHPVRDFLDTLVWDGIERLDTLIIDYLGAEDTPLNRAMTRKTFTAAVARIYKPGVKFEAMLTLVGEQGIGKSTLINKMSKGWFSDSVTISKGRDAMDQLDGVWIAEMAELTASRRAEVEEFKRFISSTSDNDRRAYAVRKTWSPRECIFIGSTNEHMFLKDSSGNRRYWPIETSYNATKDVFNDLDREVDQILAEAKHRFLQGEKLYLDKRSNEDLIKVHKEHFQEHPIIEAIENFLEIPLPDDYEKMNLYERVAYFLQDEPIVKKHQENGRPREKVTPLLIWQECLGNRNFKLPTMEKKIIMEYFKSHPDWEYKSIRISHYARSSTWGFERKNKKNCRKNQLRQKREFATLLRH